MEGKIKRTARMKTRGRKDEVGDDDNRDSSEERKIKSKKIKEG